MKRFAEGPGNRVACALLAGAAFGLTAQVALAQTAAAEAKAPAADAKGAAPAAQNDKSDKEGAARKTAPAAAMGGYTWSEKPRPRARRRQTAPVDVNAPQATYPGFQMLADGSSQLILDVSRFVAVTLKKERQVYAYQLQGVHVGVRNNTFPLDTRHFRSAVMLAQLQPSPDGARLVVRLRPEEAAASANLQHRVQARPGGHMRLIVSIPAPRVVPRTTGDLESPDDSAEGRAKGPLSGQSRGPEL